MAKKGKKKKHWKLYFLLSQSGGGKDTQAEFVEKYLTNKQVPYIYKSIGTAVRNFSAKCKQVTSTPLHFPKQMKKSNEAGKLQPAVLALYFFLEEFMEQYTGSEVVIVNGSPRSYEELLIWTTLIKSGYLPNATIINIDVTDEECRKRIAQRTGRQDTANKKSLETKLAWYGPIRKMLAGSLPKEFKVKTIDGMGSIKQTAKQIKTFLKKDLGINKSKKRK